MTDKPSFNVNFEGNHGVQNQFGDNNSQTQTNNFGKEKSVIDQVYDAIAESVKDDPEAVKAVEELREEEKKPEAEREPGRIQKAMGFLAKHKTAISVGLHGLGIAALQASIPQFAVAAPFLQVALDTLKTVEVKKGEAEDAGE